MIVKSLLPKVGIFAILLTSCSGGGSTTGPALIPAIYTPGPTTGYPVSPPPGSTTTPSNTASAIFTITIPRSESAVSSKTKTRHPAYVSTNTQSIQIQMTSFDGSSYAALPPNVSNLTTTSPNCIAGSGDSNLTCTINFSSLPIGTDGFTVQTYGQPLAAGNPLSSIKTTAIIVVGSVTNVPLTLQGVIASLAVNVASTLVPTVSSTNTATISAYDASGAQIIGSAPYNDGPIVVTTDDILDAITGLTNLATPGLTETFAYDGAMIGNNIEHIIATTGNITASGSIPLRIDPFTLSVVGIPIDVATNSLVGSGPYAVSSFNDSKIVVQALQNDWGSELGNPFTISTNTCGANVVVTNGPGVDQFTLKSGGTTASTCSIVFAAGEGATTTINYTQTQGTNGVNLQLNSTTRKP